MNKLISSSFLATIFMVGMIVATPATLKPITAEAEPGSVLKLASTNVPIDIPLFKGYENGNDIYYIVTDVSDGEVAQQITEFSNFPVNTAPALAQTPEDVRGQAYAFKNGVEGDGLLGFQIGVLSAKPGDDTYSPLYQVNFVEWTDDGKASELKSVDEIMSAEEAGDVSIEQTDIIVNKPAVQWNDGSLVVKEDTNITDDSKYGGGQVLEIDTENMVVTFVAHRGWGPTGDTIYYIVTDAVPEMPANMMGVVYAPSDEKLATTPVAVDLFQFKNGINGTGPLGFQPGVSAAGPTDENYSPMWKIFMSEWQNPSDARLLETIADINSAQSDGLINIVPAMEGKHIVNCPFFDQSTVLEHKSSKF